MSYRLLVSTLVLSTLCVLTAGTAWGQDASQTVNRFLGAVRDGNQDVVKMMLEIGDVSTDVSDPGGRGAVHYAVQFKKHEMLRLLLELGFDSMTRDEMDLSNRGYSPPVDEPDNSETAEYDDEPVSPPPEQTGGQSREDVFNELNAQMSGYFRQKRFGE